MITGNSRDSSLAQNSTGKNSMRVKNRVRISDKVRNKEELLWWLLSMATLGYGEPEPNKIWTSAPSD